MAFEENEISINSHGGTELVKRGLAKLLPQEKVDQFQVISSRVRELEEDKIRVYWLHDLAGDPELSHLKESTSRDRFHRIVFCSNWQYQQFQNYLGVPLDQHSIVIENPVEPIPMIEKPTDVINLVYHSTPQRGLDILVPVFEELAKEHKHIHLHVFSSFLIYGWEERDKQYENLYERIRQHPQMTYHGFASNDVVREQLQKSHIHAFPSTWPETHCRCLVEAMSAGMLCVHPNFAALPDTAGGLTFMYQGDSDPNKHAQVFFHSLNHAINIVRNDDLQDYLKFTKAYADSRFNYTKIASQWDDMMSNLLQMYPDAESRKLPGAMFVYRP